jgi:Uma2 family endonuclease
MAVAGTHRFTVDDFARMGEAGIFTEDDRVELIDGEIRDMTPIGQPHAWIVNRLTRRLVLRLADRAYVSVQNPLRLDGHSEPLPDLVVARGGEDDYADRHLEAGDVLLVVEVADSSLRYDLAEKMPRYARSGIPEAWLVDVAGGAVTVSTGPGPDGYVDRRVFRRGEEIASTAIAGLRVTVDEVVGRRGDRRR